MSIMKMWRKLQGYRLWKPAMEPMIWNEETGELQRFISFAEMPHGTG
jgi:hypothetical protein